MPFREAIENLKSKQQDYAIELLEIENWLIENQKLYNQSISNYSCSIHKPKLPCFCYNRKTDCLFIDIFNLLKQHKELISKEKIFGNYVAEYNLLKSNGIDLTNWLIDYRKFYYDTIINENGIILQLNASKRNNEYLKFIIRIRKKEFTNHNRLNKILNELIEIE